MANIITTNNNSKDDMIQHVAVFAFPFSTHGTPLLSITRRLASLSPPNVHFSFFSTTQSIKLLFPQGESLFPNNNNNNIRPYEFLEGKPDGDHQEIGRFLKEAVAPGALSKAVAAAEAEVGGKVSCVMADAFLWFLGDFAEEIGVPWVACWISGDHSLCVHVYTDLIRHTFGTQGVEGREEETLDFIPGLSKIRVKDIPDGVVTGNLESLFAQMLHQMGRALPRAAAVCINTCEELDPVVIHDLKSKCPKVFTVGPLNLISPPPKLPADSYNCLTWLDKQKPNSVVYVGFGSAATPPPTELVALAEALQASGVKFLWSLKDHFKVHLPKGFLEKNREKGMIAPWVPQIEVLSHEAVGVFITHFGYGSVSESIAAEVPMIGRPFFGDHPLNGRLVEAVWEVGLQVQGGVFTKEGVLKCLDQILWSDQGHKIRRNIKNLKELVTKAVAPNGSSNQNFKLLLQVITN